MSAFDVFDNVPPRYRNSQSSTSQTIESFERKIFLASSRGQLAVLSALLDANPEADTNYMVNGMNALHIACKKGFHEIVAKLLQHPRTDPNICSANNNETAIMIASYSGHRTVIEILNQNVSSNDLQALDIAGNSALHFSAWGGNLSCVQFLIEQCHCNPTLQNNEGLTPLQLAAAGNHVEIVFYLTQLTSSHESSTTAGLNPLHRAASHGALETLQILLNQNIFDINATTINGSTALHLAAQHGHLPVVQLLCNNLLIVDKDKQNDFGLTALHYACIQGYFQVVVFLLLSTVNCNPAIKNNQGEQCLHLSAAAGHHELCQLLVIHGKVDVFDMDGKGKTAIDRALDSGYKELANKLALLATVEMRLKEICT